MQPSDLRVYRATLDNGLRVVSVLQPQLHGICVSLHLHVGSRFETERNSGCSHMLEHMLFRGTPTYPTAHRQARAVERLGGTLYAATHTERGHMSVTLPPESFRAGVTLFGEIVSSPMFADLDVERGIIREEILEGLDEDGHLVDPDTITRAQLFPGHALGLPITGTLASIDAIDEALLREHHRRYYTGRNSVLCFAGPIDHALCEELAAAHFGGLPQGEPHAIEPPPTPRSSFRFTENQGSQTDLRLAFRAPGLHDPCEPATELLVRLLDDGMSTRLYAKICDEMGLCYDVSADYEPFADGGVLDFAAVVRHARAPRVMRELTAIVEELVRDGPTEDELQICKNRHRWELQALLDHPEGLADYHGVAQLVGHGDSLDGRQQQIEAVGRDDIVNAAQNIFRPENVCAVAVGMLRREQRKEIERVALSLRRG
ncbi:MAG: M16 family metallopeptidase [Myxococcota bacterium]